MKEAKIEISDQRLTEGQSMAVRVALQLFVMDLQENGLGEDDLGRELVANYLARIGEVNQLIALTGAVIL